MFSAARLCIVGATAAALAACASTPTGPTRRVMPPPGKPFEVFVGDDQFCRSYASQQISGDVDKANSNAVGAAVVGTALGAAAGALMGNSGQAAAAGAGAGLLFGSAVGADGSARGGWVLQHRYDLAYEQCMYSKGNLVPGQAVPYNAPPPPPEGLPPPPPQ